MRDDEADDNAKHTVSTIPPPAGESDIYEAKTQVGGLPPEALAMLRQIRDEKPMTGGGEANVPVFLDDDDPDSGPGSGRPRRIAPAAGMPATRPNAWTPATPAPAPAPKPRPATPAALTREEPDETHAPSAVAASPSAPERAMLSSPPLIAPGGASAADSESYESVFAPLPPSSAVPVLPQATGESPEGAEPPLRVWPFALVVTVVVVVAAIFMMDRAGWLPGLHPVPEPPGTSQGR